MAADLGNKITDVRNAARPNSARVSSTRTAGASTLACDNLNGWPTASKVHFVTYQIDTNSNPIDGTQLDCEGIVSSNTITSFTVIDGSDVGHSVGDVVEMLPTAAWGQDLADGLSASLNRDGSLKSGAISLSAMLTDSVVSSAKIADSAVTSAKIADGTIAFADLLSTIFSGQVQTQANAGTASGTMSYINLGGIKLLWVNTPNQISTTTGAPYAITLPVGFFSTITHVTATAINMTTDGRQYISINSFTTTQILMTFTTAVNASTGASVFIIGT